jgi:hypothetical protein
VDSVMARWWIWSRWWWWWIGSRRGMADLPRPPPASAEGGVVDQATSAVAANVADPAPLAASVAAARGTRPAPLAASAATTRRDGRARPRSRAG